MKWIRKTRGIVSRYSFFLRLLITGLLIISIPTLMLSAQNTRDRADDLLRSHQAQCEMIALTVGDQMEHYVSSLYGLSYKLHKRAGSLYQQSNPTVSQELEILQSIKTLGAGYTFLERVGLYFPYANDSAVYMDTGKYDFKIFASKVMKSEEAVLKERLLSVKSSILEWNSDSGFSGYVLPLFTYSNFRAAGSAVYLFSHSSITDAMKAILPAGCHIFSITSPGGEYLFYNQQLEKQYDPAGTEFAQVILEGKDYFYISLDNTSGYGCSLLIPQSHLTSVTNQYALLSAQYFLVTLILSLLGVAIMCVINYMPLYRLLRSVLGVQHVKRSQDEFSILHETYQSHEESYKQIQTSLREERLWLIDHIYDRLLRKMPVSQDELKILYPYMPCYVIACVQMDNRMMQLIKDYTNQLLSPVYVLNSDSRPIFICRVEQQNENGIQEAMENVRRIANCTEMAVSSISDDLLELSARYQEACDAMMQLRNRQISEAEAEEEFWENQLEERNENHLKIIDYIEQHFTDPALSVTAIAEELDTSEYTAGRLIRNIYGPNFRRVINEKRLVYAKALLLTSDYPVVDVSKMAGFQSSSYFIKMFKQTEGITPAQYRAKMKQIACEEEDDSIPPKNKG